MAYDLVSAGVFESEPVHRALKQLGYGVAQAQRLVDRGRVFVACSDNKSDIDFTPLCQTSKNLDALSPVNPDLSASQSAFLNLKENKDADISKSQRAVTTIKKTLYPSFKGAPRQVKSKAELINGELLILRYVPRPKGLKPIFECDEFAVFDKPSGVLSHPNGRNCEYSLYDEIYSLYGEQACVAHRLDKDTSGLIVVAKNGASARALKGAFEARRVRKAYVTLVRGRVDMQELVKQGLASWADESILNLDDNFRQNLSDKSYQNGVKSPVFTPIFSSKHQTQDLINKDKVKRSSFIFKDFMREIDLGNKPYFRRDEMSQNGKNKEQITPIKTVVYPPKMLDNLSSKNSSQNGLNLPCSYSPANGVHISQTRAGGSEINQQNLTSEHNLSQQECVKSPLKRASLGAKIAISAPLGLANAAGVAKIKMSVRDDGKHAVTLLSVLKYDPLNNATLVCCEPLTGRQHQIRAHMFHMKHSILGDTLYGVSDEVARAILDGKLTEQEIAVATGAPRLCLHASELEFEFNGQWYKFKSDSYLSGFGF